MKLYEVFNPELNVNVRFKVLTEQETYQLVSQHGQTSQEEFMGAVLEAVVHNLKGDVTSSIKKIPKETAKNILSSLYNCCLMLNPGLDVMSWLQIAVSPLIVSNMASEQPTSASKKPRRRPTTTIRKTGIERISRTKFLNLEQYLKDNVIGQDEAIGDLVAALKRSHVGLNDAERPLGVFVFAGASGVGKTLIAKELHKYLFGESEMVRIDCGEYQHKHENQKLIGSPNGYLGHDEGGQLTNAILKNPHTVLLLDEVEKAHPDIWNTFLRVFDEGFMTDNAGKKVSFQNTIIIMTTNLGNETIVKDLRGRRVGFHSDKNDAAVQRERVIRITNEAIQKYFRPEFLNRIDKTVVFNQLSSNDYTKIAAIELSTVESKLEKKGYSFSYADNVIDAMIDGGTDDIQGARGLSQIRRDRIENTLANLLLSKRHPKGTIFKLSFDEDFIVDALSGSATRECTDIVSTENVATAGFDSDT